MRKGFAPVIIVLIALTVISTLSFTANRIANKPPSPTPVRCIGDECLFPTAGIPPPTWKPDTKLTSVLFSTPRPTKTPVPTSTNTPTPTITPTPTPIPTSTPYIPPSPTLAPNQPTNTPKPTITPKPTKTPIPPPITTDLRPGGSLDEIFQLVGQRTCFPPPLLHAFQTVESGVFFNYNNSSSIIKIYNTYGWWKTGTGDPCFGLGYHTQTGIVPADSVGAGIRCRNAVGSPDDYAIMGVLQVSDFEQTATRKYTTAILPNSIDRRVLFDNAIIFAIATKNKMGTPPANCNTWPDDAVLLAAEKHIGNGNCSIANYCQTVLNYYKQYR